MAETLSNISLGSLNKKRFTIDGDENRILELNTSDLSVISRVDEFDKAVTEEFEKFVEEQDKFTGEDFDFKRLGELLTEIDKFIREKLDWLYDAKISETLAPFGTMLDPINGDFRFQIINDILVGLYDKQFTKELKVRNDKIRQHTKKYVDKVNKA